jgi:hypothetical protein
VRRWAIPLACLAVAGAAAAAAVLSGKPQPPKQDTANFIFFPDSSGVRWSSLDKPGPLVLGGRGNRWLAFRGFSLGQAGSVSLLSDGGTRYGTPIDTTPKVHLIGPIDLTGRTAFWLTPGPAANRPRSPAGGEIFLSQYRLFRYPLAALPGPGFWPSGVDPIDPTGAQWLNTQGTVDVAAASRALTRFWLSFAVTSVDKARTLTLSQGARAFRVSVPQKGTSRTATVGPFGLSGGRTQVRFSSPGPAVYAGDLRRRSVEISKLEPLPLPPRG